MIHQIEINKISQTATVVPDLNVGELDRLLSIEGFVSGYLPIEGVQPTLEECVMERKPNLYFLKYGGIDELCVGGLFVTKGGKRIFLKHVPRAAAGPDLKKVLIGSQGHVGHFDEIMLKIFSIPEYELWGVAFFENEKSSLAFVRHIYSQGVKPLFIKLAQGSECKGVSRSLNLMRQYDFGVVIKLSGLKRMVSAERRMIDQYAQLKDLHWASQNAEASILEETVINGESLKQLWLKTGSLFMGETKTMVTPEKKWIQYMEKNPC